MISFFIHVSTSGDCSWPFFFFFFLSRLINILMQEHRASLAPPTTGGCEQTICSVHNHQTPEAGTELGLD